ncbi:MAG: hypothetical protein V9H26_15080 [Verrucomicrobiota bacterium]|nr:hypothetical protein [Limisphaerales bacterium]
MNPDPEGEYPLTAIDPVASLAAMFDFLTSFTNTMKRPPATNAVELATCPPPALTTT